MTSTCYPPHVEPATLADDRYSPPDADQGADVNFWPADLQAEFDIDLPPSQRFDEPTGEEIALCFEHPQVRLEKRGVTAPKTRNQRGSRHPRWQLEFWGRQSAHKNSVAAKLRSIGEHELAAGLESCHSTFTIAHCNDCGKEQRFPNRCDNFYCPECQPRLSAERRKAVEWWTHLVTQPKHVVLTVRNTTDFTKAHILEFKKWFSALRRRKFCRAWRGGFYSLEVTNEGNGWHLHLHALVDADYIDKRGLSDAWASATNGFGRIVDVSDARRKDYLAEVTKYSVKGVMLAAWRPDQILTFITAFSGVRSFGVFGQLYGARTEFAEFIATLKAAKPKCDCGSCNVVYRSEVDAIVRDFSPANDAQNRSRPPTDPQLNLIAPTHQLPR